MNVPHEQIISGVGFRTYEFSEIMRMWMNFLMNVSFHILEFTDTTEFLACWNANQLFDILVLRLYGKATATSKVSELQHITQHHHELGLPTIIIAEHASWVDYAYEIGALALLVPPLDTNTLLHTIGRAIEKAMLRRKKLFVYMRNSVAQALPLQGVCWVRKQQDNALFHMCNTSQIIACSASEAKLEKIDCFTPISASVWVNLRRVREIHTDRIVLDDSAQTELRIARGSLRKVREAYRLFCQAIRL